MNNNLTIIGIGRLGLCQALCFEKSGYNVLGIDVNQDYINSINNKTYTSFEPNLINYLNKSTNLRASTNLEEGLNFSDIIFITVPTPDGGKDKSYDHSILGKLLTTINKYKPTNKHFIICCTTMPTYIDKIGKYLLSDCSNCTLNYNPEFIAQGNIIYGMENPDIVLIGCENENIGNIIKNIYKNVVLNEPRYCLMTPLEAEITKISINGFITMKITYANMIGDLCSNLNCNKNTVLNSIGGDTRIGNKYFKAGLSYGGPCFPRDTLALNMVLENNSIKTNIINSVDKYNDQHIIEEADKIYQQHIINNNLTIKFTNICYKENSNVPIIEYSPKLRMAEYLYKKYNNINIVIEDEQHMIDLVKIEYGNIFTYQIL